MSANSEPFNAAQYLEISDLYSAVEVLRDKGLLPTDVESDVTGFRLIAAENKEELVGMPFLVVSATRRKAFEHDSSYVDIMLVTAEDKRIWMRDSSRGIAQQFEYMFNALGTDVIYGIWVRRGLRFEDKPFAHPSGREIMARTYYMKGIIPRNLGSSDE